jgi:hypothetical protein
MARDVPLGAAAVGSLDRVDPELEIAAAVENPRRDDPLDELGVRGLIGVARVGGGGARAGVADPSRPVGQAGTASRSEIRLSPVSRSKRWSLEYGRISSRTSPGLTR